MKRIITPVLIIVLLTTLSLVSAVCLTTAKQNSLATKNIVTESTFISGKILNDPDKEINWPARSQASFGTLKDGVLLSSPNQTARPTASTAKLITALTILQKKPLRHGESGPILAMTGEDTALLDYYLSIGGSYATTKVGETLTQYQMLQGILITSANNFADRLAIWAFGSLEDYRQAAQDYVNSIGLKKHHYRLRC